MAKKHVTIYHNPKCGTSRTVLALLRESGIEPTVVEYLKTPPTKTELKSLAARNGGGVAAILRWKEPLAKELKLDKDKSSDNQLLDAMAANPILIERPIVVTDKAVKLCRPSETVKELLS
jgi:arsenate reductase